MPPSILLDATCRTFFVRSCAHGPAGMLIEMHNDLPGDGSYSTRAINPGGVVYGVLAVATVIAAESTRRETFPKLFLASVLTMALYWLAHAYSHHWGTRLDKAGEWSLDEIVLSLKREASILLGAALPTVVLVLGWIAGSSTETAVTAVLWTAGVELLLLEAIPGIRHRLALRDHVLQALIGISMAGGILGLRVLLH